jgi:hypothetical protein
VFDLVARHGIDLPGRTLGLDPGRPCHLQDVPCRTARRTMG